MLVLSAGPASTDTLQPLAAGVDDEPPPEPRGPDAPPVINRYDPSVEQWRSQIWQGMPDSLKSRPDAATLLDKTLHAVQGESGGDPTVPGDGGLAHGLFQSHYVGAGATPQAQIADAWRLVEGDIRNGGTGFGDWGEGRSYQGQPFGAFGRTPYGAGNPLAQHLSTGQTSSFIPGPSIAPQPFSPYVPQPDPFAVTGAEQQMQYQQPQQDVTPYQPYVGSALQEHLSTGGPRLLDVTNPSDYQTLQEQVEGAMAPPQEGYTYDPNVMQSRANSVLGPSDNPLGKVLNVAGTVERNTRIADIPYADRVANFVGNQVNASPAVEGYNIGAGLANRVSNAAGEPRIAPSAGEIASGFVPRNIRDAALLGYGPAKDALERYALSGLPEELPRAPQAAAVAERQGIPRAVEAAAGAEPRPGPTDVGRPARPGMQFQPVGGGAPEPAEEAAQGAGRALPAGTTRTYPDSLQFTDRQSAELVQGRLGLYSHEDVNLPRASWETISQATQRLRDAGVDIPVVVSPRTQAMSSDFGGAVAVAGASDAEPYGRPTAAVIHPSFAKSAPANEIAETLAHEAGHIADYDTLRRTSWKDSGIDPGEVQALRDDPSSQVRFKPDPDEFVAEIYGRSVLGESVSAGDRRLYEQLNGPQIPTTPTGAATPPTPATTVPAGTAAQPTTTNAPTPVTTTTQPPVGGAQPALPPIGDSGIKDALARKEEATLTPGQVFGPEGSIQRKVAGAINPSVDLPRSVHVANQARTAVQATLRTEFGRSEIPATRAIATRFDAEKPKYLGPAGRSDAGEWTDYALNPGYYQASPELTAAKDALKAVQDANLAKARSEYGVEVGRFEPRDPDGVYLPNLTSREAEEKAVQAVAGSLSSHGSVTAERAYNDINDRLAKHPDWQPERDPGVLADTHSSALARIAGNNTFKAGVGGKTKLEVVDELHPGLVKARDKVREDIANLRGRVQTALQQAKTSGAISKLTAAQEKAATARSALIDARVQSLGQEYGPELSHLSGQLHELRRQVNQLSGLQSAVGARAVGATARAAGFRSQITSLQTQLEGLAQQVRTAGTGDYALNPTTYRYHEPAVSAAIESVTRPATFHNAFIDTALKLGNTMRAVGLGPDFSPLTIQGLLGALSHPDVLIANAANFAKIFNSDEALQRLLDPELVRRYEFASGRPLGSASEDLLKSTVGPQIGLGNRPVKRFNDALERVLDYGSLKAFEADSKILQSGRNGLPQNVADHEAESALSKVVPRINNPAQGRSPQRVSLEGALPTSRSFTVQPFALAKDFASGAAKLTRGAAGKIPGVSPGPELSGREDLAIIRGIALLGSLMTISITSALLSAEANKKDPVQAVKEVMDPSSGKFFNLILGNQGSIGLGGPMRSAFLGVWRTMTQGPQGGINYARSRLEPVLGAGVDVVSNTDFRGNPVRTGSPWNQMLQSAVHIAQGANLLGGGISQGYGESGVQGAAEQAVSGLGGVNYQERSQYEKRDLIARQGIQVKQPDGSTKLMKANSYQSASPLLKDAINKMNVTDLSDYRKASDTVHQTSKAEVSREEDLFNKGQNDQALRDVYQREGERNRALATSLENQFASQFAGFDKSKYDNAVEGYYALSQAKENQIPEGELGAGGIDFDKVASAQKDYLANLPADQRQWVSEALQVAEANKTPLHREYDKYIDAKKQAGYFVTHIDPVTKRPTGITPQERQALDIAHPDLDVASWRFGSVGGKAGSALNSPGAVQMALQTPDAQNKEITYAGLPRPVNQSPDTIAMWNYAKGPLDWYLTQLPNGQDAVGEGKRLAADKGDKEYLKPLDQMDTQHRSTITTNLHNAALKSNLGDELQAYLYAFGERTSFTTQAAADKAAEIIKKYHLDQVKAPMKKAA